MAAKTIAVDADAYGILARAKKPGETFSDVIRRTVQSHRPLTDFAGAWKAIPDERIHELTRWRQENRKKDLARQRRMIQKGR